MTNDAPEEYHGDLTTVAKRLTMTEAAMLKSVLEAGGVPTQVGDVQAGTLWGDMVGGNTVRVPAKFVDQAKEVIAAYKDGAFQLDENFVESGAVEESVSAAPAGAEPDALLNTYHVYQHADQPVPVVVKDGFDWMAALFAPLWFVLNRMWVSFFVLMALVVAGKYLLDLVLPESERSPWYSYGVLLGVAAGCFVVGKIANTLLRANLEGRGYKLLATVEAKNVAYAREAGLQVAQSRVPLKKRT